MKRKEPPGGSTRKTIRPVLYYPDAADDEPSQVIMPSSPPLGPRSSPDRGLDNIGYEPENIPTPRASLYLAAQSSPVRQYTARVQPSSVKRIGSASRLFAPVRYVPPPAPDDDDDVSDYVIDTDDERPETGTVSTTSPQTNTSPFKPTRRFEPPRRAQPSPVKTWPVTKPRSPPKPQSSQQTTFSKPPSVIDLLSSSDSEPDPTPTRTSSPSLGSYPSPEIQIVDTPSSSDVEEVVAPHPSTRETRRRIVSPPGMKRLGDLSRLNYVGGPSHPNSVTPRVLGRPRGRAGRSSSNTASSSKSGPTRPPMVSRSSEDLFFRPSVPETRLGTEDRQSVGGTEDTAPAEPLPHSSLPSTPAPPLSEPTPTPTPELDLSAPSTSAPKIPARVTRMRMECVLLPRPSRATLNALARFENQTRAGGLGKGKGKARFIIDIPPASKARGRKSVGGLGKGLGKGAYAAREEGRWESSSPTREDADVDMEVDEIDLIRMREQDEDEFIDVDGNSSSADSEPEISFVGMKTPSNRNRGRQPSSRSARKRASPSPSPCPPTRTPRTPRTKIQLDPRVDVASTYRSLPTDIKESGDKYCHCCRAVKNGKLKMRCTNQVSNARKRRWSKPDGEVHLCGTWWCQRCAVRNGIEFDLLAGEFTCPMCDDTCVCDKCRKRREQEAEERERTGRRVSGESAVVEQEEEVEVEEQPGEQEGDEEQEEQAQAQTHEPEQEREEEPGQQQEDQPEPSQRSSTLSEPPPLEEPDESTLPSSSTNDPNAKRAGYAELMRQRGPTKWHGRRTPPPLRRASNHPAASTNDVYIPRGPVEATEATGSRPISPPVSIRAESLPVLSMDADALILQDVFLGSFDADYSAHHDASFMGADSAGLAIEIEELLHVDKIASAEPEDLNEAILGLGPPTLLPDDDSVFAGLDANLRAASSRHFYDPVPHPHLRFGIQDVMLASPNLVPDLFGFELSVAGAGVVAPSQLSRSPTADPFLEPVDPPPPAAVFEPEPVQPLPLIPGFEPEPETVPDLTMAESAKSTDVSTPSPQFDADAGLEGGPELQDLFGGQLQDHGLVEMEAQKLFPEHTSNESSTDITPVESAPVEPSTIPTQNPADTTPTSPTFVAPTPENTTRVRSKLKRRSQAQTQAQPTDQGRVTRSRSRRSF
ncbi:hypothetical protein RhiJN_04959 [Ceratobasidium sp. AG-Ba]|nr:hypothetical protein RhiJN_04959 [Ceratobasidium sp. AG-Ba]